MESIIIDQSIHCGYDYFDHMHRLLKAHKTIKISNFIGVCFNTYLIICMKYGLEIAMFNARLLVIAFFLK